MENTSTNISATEGNTIENFWNAHSKLLSKKINDEYNTVVPCRKSLSSLPSESVAKRFIEEIAKLVNSWTCKTKQDSTAMKALRI